MAARLSLKDALMAEGADSPFTQLMVTRAALLRDPRIERFVAYYRSEATRRFIEERYKGALVPAWRTNG
jgi:D-methionine transport system substrate-binding protein